IKTVVAVGFAREAIWWILLVIEVMEVVTNSRIPNPKANPLYCWTVTSPQNSNNDFLFSRAVQKSIDSQFCCDAGRKMERNVVSVATSTGEVVTAEPTTTEMATTKLPSKLVQKIQEVWNKVDDKYAVSSLGVAAFILLWSSTRVISAIDRLPLIPSVLKLVGIGYTGWFAYKNLIFKPNREVLIAKIKDLYKYIIESS
ncbi:Protein CURVATURE THYLAKOID 1B, chloroplastic, partial [Capsicum annuum]